MALIDTDRTAVGKPCLSRRDGGKLARNQQHEENEHDAEHKRRLTAEDASRRAQVERQRLNDEGAREGSKQAHPAAD